MCRSSSVTGKMSLLAYVFIVPTALISCLYPSLQGNLDLLHLSFLLSFLIEVGNHHSTHLNSSPLQAVPDPVLPQLGEFLKGGQIDRRRLGVLLLEALEKVVEGVYVFLLDVGHFFLLARRLWLFVRKSAPDGLPNFRTAPACTTINPHNACYQDNYQYKNNNFHLFLPFT